MSGHDHTYERLEQDGLPYIVNGLGSGGRYDFEEVLDGSQVRYNSEYGAMKITAASTSLAFEFLTTTNKLVDQKVIFK
ncbi:MAG: hypothetical protein FIA98_00565 [Anaerolineae bacterium]|nr:hypothetical protein [Anaerolineae bacterium]